MADSDARGPVVVVTGGAGFIGSHTVDRLAGEGCQVVVLDNFSTGKRENLARWDGDPRVEILVVDVADGIFAPLVDVVRRRGPVERIVHLAAQVSVIHSIENPLDDVRVNYGATVQVLEYARRHRVRKVVFSSSAAVYGDVAELPVAETARPEPVSPYGIDKRASELALRYYAVVHGVPSTALRFFNVYGPRQDPSSPYSGVISIFCDRAAAGETLTIFGDGRQTRDFVYVEDVARAVAAACLGDGGRGDVANIGTGAETTVAELARQVVALCGGRSEIRHAPARPGEILRSLARVSRMAELLDVRAEIPLNEGLAQTIAWMRGG